MPLSSLKNMSWCRFSCKDCLYIISATVKYLTHLLPEHHFNADAHLFWQSGHTFKKKPQYLSCFHHPSDVLITFKYGDYECSKNLCKIYHIGGRKLSKGPFDVMDSSNNNFLSFVV